MNKRKNECLIDWLRFSVKDSTIENVANNLLNIPYDYFMGESKISPYQTYSYYLSFANIEIHASTKHGSILVNLSGKACRQYEEFMSSIDGWHWQAFINNLLSNDASPSRIDLALDIFDSSSPDVKKLQDYVKRGQLSTKAHKFKELNSGKILDGKLSGFTLYIGSQPQILRIYDKKQEVRDNTGELLNIEKWIRWELQLSDKKALVVCDNLANGTPLNTVIRGILGSHYAFKTQPKGKIDFHNKSRWNNMKWWDKFIENMPSIPLKTVKNKPTLREKKLWIEKSTAKSWAMIYESYKIAFGEDFANAFVIQQLLSGKEKFTDDDLKLIKQSIIELTNNEEY